MKKRTDLMSALWANVQKDKERRDTSRKHSDVIDALRGFLRGHQKRLEADISKLISVISPRQTGKSTGALIIAAIRCLQKDNASWIVIGQTRRNVKKVYWADLQRLSERFDLHIKFHHTELTATFPNGSIIYFEGLDKFDELEKLRGGRYHGAIVDECKSLPELTFKTLLDDILGPALIGQAGPLIIIGTPGDVLRGEFYLATCDPPVLLDLGNGKRWSNWPCGVESDGIEHIWSFHRWTLQDNDVVFTDPQSGRTFTLWQEALAKKESKGWKDDHPVWRREYLGHWVATNVRLVYRYKPHIHDYIKQPNSKHWGIPCPDEVKWHTAIGADFGTQDGTGFVVWAWSDTFEGLWELYSEKRKTNSDLRLSVSAIARWYREVEDIYGPFDGIVGDPAGLGTMVIETLAVDHQVYFEAAKKADKVDHIELFNNDLDAGIIHILKGSELSEELIANRWLLKTIGTDKRKEDPETPNDLCDAGIYSFRWCRHRQAKPEAEQIKVGSLEWYLQMERNELESAKLRAKSAKEPNQLDKEWWNINDPDRFN
jgi:hypothetical protein